MKLSDVESTMKKAIDSTMRSFNTIRTGRASSSLLDKIIVEYYGAPTPLNQMANISTPDSSTLQIQPYDRTTMGAIEKAISLSDIGLTPNNDGVSVRLNIPALTSERRKEFVKMASKYAEEGKVAIRHIRRDGVDGVRKLEKASEISEDESRDQQDKIQKLTDKYVAEVDRVFAEKERDILKV
ncbi:MAG: ribosome recycling factor [Alkalinema sp. FL-bin-369]|nr:ribosome recycling factor [Leptolyngbyaceae cyanobacterium LF-bin-369]